MILYKPVESSKNFDNTLYYPVINSSVKKTVLLVYDNKLYMSHLSLEKEFVSVKPMNEEVFKLHRICHEQIGYAIPTIKKESFYALIARYNEYSFVGIDQSCVISNYYEETGNEFCMYSIKEREPVLKIIDTRFYHIFLFKDLERNKIDKEKFGLLEL